jgi:hypothetical protein
MTRIVVREKLFADVWRPVIGWGIDFATEASFKLTRVIHLTQLWRVGSTFDRYLRSRDRI